MTRTPRMSLRRYLYTVMATVTIAWIVVVPIFVYVLRWSLNFPTRSILTFVVLLGPVVSVSALYGFYKGCVLYYGLNGDDRLLPLEGQARDLMDRLKPGP